jgi:transcription elongation factor Elf1
VSRYKPNYKCPFCGSEELKHWTLMGSNRHYTILCTGCGCLGPTYEMDEPNTKFGQKGAVMLWDKRFSKS